jgi:hypothetical protein
VVWSVLLLVQLQVFDTGSTFSGDLGLDKEKSFQRTRFSLHSDETEQNLCNCYQTQFCSWWSSPTGSQDLVLILTIKYHQRESLASFASAPKQNSPIGGLLELASHLLLGIHRRNILLRRPSDVTALLRQRFFTRVTVTVRASDVSALQYILMRHFCCDVSAT